MIYVIDFTGGKHTTNQQVANLLKNESTYQPIEIDGEMGFVDELNFTELLKKVSDSEDDELVIFVESVDGPSFNRSTFEWIKNSLSVKCFVDNNI